MQNVNNCPCFTEDLTADRRSDSLDFKGKRGRDWNSRTMVYILCDFKQEVKPVKTADRILTNPFYSL